MHDPSVIMRDLERLSHTYDDARYGIFEKPPHCIGARCMTVLQRISNFHDDALPLFDGSGRDYGTHRFRDPSLLADYFADIVGMNGKLVHQALASSLT